MTTPESTPSPMNPVLTFLRRFWLPLLIAIVVIVFISQNRVETQIQMLGFSFNFPLWLTLTVVSLIAFLVGYFMGKRRK